MTATVAWVAEELRFTDLGDTRRNRRLACIVEDLAAQPSASVPQASRTPAALQATYDFWKSPYIKPAAILASHQQSTVERMQGAAIVLAIQDTTEFNFTQHRSKQGMGPLDHPNMQGLKCHSILCVTGEGIPLGILHQQVWARDAATQGKRHQRHQRAIQDKESQRWLDSLDVTTRVIPQDIDWIMVGDREADIYDLFMRASTRQVDFLIRAAQNRTVQSDNLSSETVLLETAIRQIPVRGRINLEVCRTPQREPRRVTLTVRFATVELHPPRNRPRKDGLLPLPVQVILAEEEHPLDGEEAIRWLLLTTVTVNDLQEARQCLRWYSYRWLIERYHYVLKSGCHIEQLQLETADRIERALATYAMVAWRLLWLTYLARQAPEQACDAVFEAYEWQALYCTIHHTSLLPSTPPTLHECIRWIAQLGGFIGRKGDGEPGAKTIWRGLQRLHDIAQTWQLAHPEIRCFQC